MTRTPRTVIVEEVEFMASYGLSPSGIATDLGKDPAAIARALYRAGRHDLAAPFNRLAHKARPERDRKTATCADCRTPIWRGATRCHPCEVTRRWAGAA